MMKAALLGAAAATSLASPVPVATAGAMKMNPNYGLPTPGTWYAYNNTDMYVSLDKRVGMTEWPIAYLAEAPVAGDAPIPPPPPPGAAECTGTYTSISFSVSRWSSTSDADPAAQPTHSAWFSYAQGAQRNCTDADNVTDPAASGPVVKEAGGVEGGVGLGGDSGGDAARLPAGIMPPFAPACCEDNVMWYGDKPLTDGDFTWSTDDSGSLFANATLTIPVTGSSTTAAVTTDLGTATAAVAVVFNCLPPGVGVTEGNGTTKQCQGTTCVLSTDASATTTCAFNQGAEPGEPGITAADAFDATGTLEVVGQEGVNFNLEDLPDGFLVSISSTNSTSSTRVTAA